MAYDNDTLLGWTFNIKSPFQEWKFVLYILHESKFIGVLIIISLFTHYNKNNGTIKKRVNLYFNSSRCDL